MVARSYAAVGAKVVPTKVDKSAIEEDAEKLATHVCINYFIQGSCLFFLFGLSLKWKSSNSIDTA